MKKISNDEFRKFILKSILFNNKIDTNLDERTHLYFVSKKLEKMKESNNDLFFSIYNGVITTVFLDTFKILNAKLKESTITYEEKRSYDIVASISSFEDFENALFSDVFLLEELLKYSLDFYRLNDLRKITIIKKMSEAQKYFLETKFELFKNDLEEYDNKEKFSMHVLTDYYESEIKKVSNSVIVDYGALSEDLLEEIEGFVLMLAGYDADSFEELMADIILLDYKWSKYLIDKKFNIETIYLEESKERISMVENNNIISLIKNEVLYNDYYLKCLIDSLISIKCENLCLDKNIINEDMVENYYQNMIKKRKI